MLIYNENTLIKGWFIGNFNPTAYATDACEVAIKRYNAGEYENTHHHKIATEITMIVDGCVVMNNIEYNRGDIIVIQPNESTDFLAKTDTTTCVVKVPCVKNDKYNGVSI